MIDYHEIKEICEANSKATAELFDRFMYYAASRDNRVQKLEQQLQKYRHVLKVLDSSVVPSFQAQFFSHSVFKKGGLLGQYLKHRAFSNLNEMDQGFLDLALRYPWRFSFCEIIDQPADCFFRMQDVFTGEEYLLYSPGAQACLQERSVSLWYNLIAFNGSCWQSYGPIGNFSGLEGGDIHYFTSLLNPNKWPLDGTAIMACVEKNPVPYFALMSKTHLPLIVSRDHQVIHIKAVYDYDVFDASAVSPLFTIETSKKVSKLRLKGWDEIPHFATIYFDESVKEMHLFAMTADSFDALTTAISQCGYEVSAVPDFAINPTMFIAAETLLKRKFEFDPYSKLFHQKTSKSTQKELDKLNTFLREIMDDVNRGVKPNLKVAAAEAGVDEQTAMQLFDQLWEKVHG